MNYDIQRELLKEPIEPERFFKNQKTLNKVYLSKI